jgi:hypothetical protein
MDTDLFSDAEPSGSSSDVFDLSSVSGGSPLDETSPDAPYGYTVDPQTGERRPKKRAGRPRAKATPPPPAPNLDELKQRKAPKAADDAPPKMEKPKTSLFGKPKGEYQEPEPLPPFRAGPIAKGMNGIYRKAGKLVKMWDRNVGETIIAATHKEDEDDVTVGEAWENLARSNPRIRAFLLKMLQGDAWGGLLMAHLPIAMAVWIRLREGDGDRAGLAETAMDFMADLDPRTGQSTPSDLSQAMGGMGPEDMAQMMAFAQGMMGQLGQQQPRNQNVARVPVEGGDE